MNLWIIHLNEFKLIFMFILDRNLWTNVLVWSIIFMILLALHVLNSRRRKTRRIYSFMKEYPDVLVLGVGNILLGDEGIGVHIIRELEKEKLPGNVELMDAGTALFSIVHFLKKRKKVIVVDAAKGGGKSEYSFYFLVFLFHYSSSSQSSFLKWQIDFKCAVL